MVYEKRKSPPPVLNREVRDILADRFSLFDKLKRYQEILEGLQAAVIPGRTMDGMLHGNNVSDRTGKLGAEIADIKTAISNIETSISENENQILKIIDSIDDEYVKTLFRLRWIRGFQWKEVAGCMGKYYTECAVKNSVYRYLSKHEIKL